MKRSFRRLFCVNIIYMVIISIAFPRTVMRDRNIGSGNDNAGNVQNLLGNYFTYLKIS